MTIAFSSPVWLLGVPIILGGLWWLRPGRRTALLMADADVRMRSSGLARVLEALPLLMRAGAILSVIAALAAPQRIRTVLEPRVEGVGIALAMDLSTSMWAEDMGARLSRLDVAKATALSFIEAREDDLGLVTFAGEALTRLPLTDDGFVVQDAVRNLQVGLLTDGTDIAGAISAGAGLLADAPHPSKILILVTDGAHNKPDVDPNLAARAAAAVGVRVFAIAIGQETGRDQRSMETVLTQAARVTDGRYYQATDVETLEAIYAEIDRLVQPAEETIARIETDPLRWIFTVTALVLAIGAVLLRGSPLGVLP